MSALSSPFRSDTCTQGSGGGRGGEGRADSGGKRQHDSNLNVSVENGQFVFIRRKKNFNWICLFAVGFFKLNVVDFT